MSSLSTRVLDHVRKEPALLNTQQERQDFIRRFNHLFSLDWENQLLTIKEYLDTQKIHWFLIEALHFHDKKNENYPGERIIELLYKTGLRYEPEIDADRRSMLHSPIHYVARLHTDACGTNWSRTVSDLFIVVYNRYNLNYVDETGMTHFHVACIYGCVAVVRKFLEAGQHPDCKPFEADTCSVDPPIHLALKYEHYELVELLLLKGADPNALDTLGQSLLYYAVDRLLPNVVDLLLEHGADLSTFVFPLRCLYERFSKRMRKNMITYNLARVSSVILILESLQSKGYKLKKDEALRIFKFFDELKFFQQSCRIKDYLNEENFVSLAKRTMINPSVSLYRLIKLSRHHPSERVTYKDYWEFANSEEHRDMYKRKDCDAYLCKILARKFFQRWAPFPGFKGLLLV
ncbi:unnamed protein product [Trichogramma brassicae]|uniref:Uncharacterized protein n=1 Tax=Trichogramma brassicae TaxID=86971 RepID=A0A6H5HV59_9HYME|nr:unnamed protein product [Trichogramma brassicae]